MNAKIAGIELQTAGVILMAVGVIGLVISFAVMTVWSDRRRRVDAVERYRVVERDRPYPWLRRSAFHRLHGGAGAGPGPGVGVAPTEFLAAAVLYRATGAGGLELAPQPAAWARASAYCIDLTA